MSKWVSKYGTEHFRELTDLELELRCYLKWPIWNKEGKINTHWTDHFRNVVLKLWGPKNKNKTVEFNPWLDAQLEAAHFHPTTGDIYPHVSFSGCASSGKTLYLALHGMINWLAAPIDTLVMMTSTNLRDARKRVWAEVRKLWQGVDPNVLILPGTFIDSRGLIVTTMDGQKYPDTSGISLIAGEKKKEKEAIGKIIGAKNKRVFMMADELPELTEAILEASFSNLIANPQFQFLAGGNFKNRYDPFGLFSEPIDGYESLTIDSIKWDTKYGHCLRFDGMKSPNLEEGEDKWLGIYSSKHLKKHRQIYNEHQIAFWRMVRSFEAPIGSTDCIYSEADFQAGGARGQIVWLGERVKLSSVDPAFTNGGDRTVQHFFWLGPDTSGKQVLQLYKTLILREDARKKDQTRNFQIAEQVVENCKAEGVHPENLGIDSTAAGGVFCDIVTELWKDDKGQVIGHKILRVDFSGNATETPVSRGDSLTARQKYDRRVTEIWYVGTEFMKHGQLKGLTEGLIREMKARNYDTVKGAEGVRMRAETKDVMKDRLGFSPDEADAYFVGLDLARQRHRFLAIGGFGTPSQESANDWDKERQIANDVYATVDYSATEQIQLLDV